MKIRVLEREIEDHYIIISIFAFFVIFNLMTINYMQHNSCQVLNPKVDCNTRIPVDRSQVQNNEWVFTPASNSLYGLDEYRQYPQFGNGHAEFKPNSVTGILHQDIFNALSYPPIGQISHLSDTLRFFLGFNGFMAVILIWAILIFIPYYSIREIILYLKK